MKYVIINCCFEYIFIGFIAAGLINLPLPCLLPLLHVFDQTISMLPFVTRTDMFDALKKTGVKTSDVDFVLASLLDKHEAVGERAQLKTLWIGPCSAPGK